MTAALIGGTVLTTLKAPAPLPPPSEAVVEAKKFTPLCTMPFKGDRTDADDHCGIAGGGKDVADQQEAMAKNNFCAPTGHPSDVTYDQLLQWQKAAQDHDPPIGKQVEDREVIQSLGEGNYVSYVAWIWDAHYSDVSSGEKVNCNKTGNPPNDIHIVLMPDKNEQDECKSTTAEMSPHYRPAGWTPQKLNALQNPVRIRGQLFYDNSHAVCGTSRPNPKRASLWEIHPVYSIDVCKSADINQCRKAADDDSQWTPIT